MRSSLDYNSAHQLHMDNEILTIIREAPGRQARVQLSGRLVWD